MEIFLFRNPRKKSALQKKRTVHGDTVLKNINNSRLLLHY